MNFETLTSNLVPSGTYKVMVDDVKYKVGTSGATSNDINIRFRILEGAYAKHTVLQTIYEKAFSFRLSPLLKACDVDMKKDFATNKELYDYGMSAMKGKIIQIDLGQRVYTDSTGKSTTFNEVLHFLPLPDSKTSMSDVTKEFGTGLDFAPAPIGDINTTAPAAVVTPLVGTPADDKHDSTAPVDDDLPF